MNDVEKKEPFSASVFGYGGPWMVPLVLGYIYKASNVVKIPICGSGGIWNWRNILQAAMAGATTVQMTTALMLKGLYDHLFSHRDV